MIRFHLVKSLRAIVSFSLLSTGLVIGSSRVASAVGPATTQIALGQSHVVAVATNGTVWTWGSLIPGPSGTGSKFSFQSPVRVTLPGARDSVDVAATRESSAALASDGTVWTWGYLGIGLGDAAQTSSSDYLNPLQVAFGSARIASLSGGCDGYIAIDTNGDVWQWGSFWGVWSLSVSRPIKVVGVSNAVSAVRSCSSAYAVLADGSIKAWGSNGGGRLGDGTTTDRSTPVSVSLPSGRSITSIDATDTHVLAIANDGTLWGWGSNSQAQLAADPAAVAYSTSPRRITVTGATGTIVSVSTTQSTPSSMVVMSSGEIWEWGTWSPTDYAPKQHSRPIADLGSIRLVSGAMYYSNMVFVGNDGSLWSRSMWNGTTTIDGNCGADSSDYTQWVNGQTIAPRYLVRAISNGQFGQTYNEDRIAVRSITTATGTNLPLDGSGTAVGKQGTNLSITVTGPSSSCYAVSSLSVSFDLNGDGTFETSGVTGTDDTGTPISTGTFALDWSGRRKGFAKVTNWDGVSKTYSFWMGVAVAAGSGGGGGSSASFLPQVATSRGTNLAVGTDGYLYGWGNTSPIVGGLHYVPTRVFTSSTTKYAKVSIFRSRQNVTAVASALTESGEVEVWGTSPNRGFLFDQNGQVVSNLTTPRTITRPNGVSKWIDLSIETCASGPVLQLLGDDQQLYVHGRNGDQCLGSSNSVPSSPASAAGMQFTKIENGMLKGPDGWALISISKVQVYGQIGQAWGYSWVSRPAFVFADGNVIPTYAPNDMTNPDGTCTYDYTVTSIQVGSTGQLEKVGHKFVGPSCSSNPRGKGTWTETSKINLSNWTTRTVIAISRSSNRWSEDFSVIASDGSIWDYFRWNSTHLVRRELDPRMATPKRFSGDYVVTSDSALWSMNRANPWDETKFGKSGLTTGNCGTNWSNDDLAGSRVFSTGQFGASFTEDRFAFQVDASERYENSNWDKSTYPGRSNDWGWKSFPTLTMRPTNSVQLYGYIHSSCEGANISSAAWDMDDDGTYESTATMTAVDNGATKMASELRDRYDAITYAGFDSSWKQIRTPVLDLSIAGGRYIGLKLTSAYGSQTKRFAVRVQPQKPSGYVGVTVNSGARFTDSADVSLNVVWPEGSTSALISNDGGFGNAQIVPIQKSIKWKLEANGSGLLSSVVYVRFLSLQPDTSTGSWTNEESGMYQVTDDIILDLSAPAVSGVNAVMSESTAFTSSIAEAMVSKRIVTNSTTQFATVTVNATDAASGIAGMQVSSDPAVPGPIRPYSSQIRIPVDRERVAVRVVDNVGLWSEWKFARLNGFVTQPEVPATPSEPSQTPAVPVPAAPVAPVVVAPVFDAPTPVAQPPALVSGPVAKAVLSGGNAKVSISVPSVLAKTCKTSVVKGKKTTTCTAVPIVVSVSGGKSKTISAKAGSNSIVLPAKKGQTITVKVNGKVVQKIKM